MKPKKLFGSLIERMKTDKRFEIGVYVVLVALIILLYALSSLDGTKAEEPAGGAAAQTAAQTAYETEQELEERLATVLSNIRGAGKVEVMITYETGTEIVPAMSVDTQNSTSTGQSSSTTSQTESSAPATVSDSGKNEPIVLTEIRPTIRGVIVIAQGAADIGVALDLQRAVQTVLGVTPDSIEVFEMSVKEE